MSLLLAIDVGNTNITLGAFRDKTLTHTWRLHTKPQATFDELGTQLLALLRHALLGYNELSGIIIASVVPALDLPLIQACTHYLSQAPLLVGSKTKLGIANRYKNPEEVGADRLVNAVAVHDLYRKKPVIVVDFGTATTFDCVSAKGEYLGGVIAPGLEIAHEALVKRAAKLSRVPFQALDFVMGKTTKESLQSGLFWGYISLVDGLLQRLTTEMRGQPVIVATGGLSTMIGPRLKPVPKILPDLTLEGLRLIWERNSSKRGSR